jgi:uncharacterized repeat protein (TIGR03803 family)
MEVGHAFRSCDIVSRRAVGVRHRADLFRCLRPGAEYHLQVIYRFSGPPDDASSPGAGVVFDSTGNLYGTTVAGGTYNAGAIFKIAKDGTETILHSFGDAASGDQPAQLTIDPATGDLYGVAYGGEFNCGQLYRFSADGTFTALHSFDCLHDGQNPSGPLFRDGHGNLYGSSIAGGAGQGGTVFEYGADGTFTVLHVLHLFTLGDGVRPVGVLTLMYGRLFGATSSSFPRHAGGGAVFSLGVIRQ